MSVNISVTNVRLQSYLNYKHRKYFFLHTYKYGKILKNRRYGPRRDLYFILHNFFCTIKSFLRNSTNVNVSFMLTTIKFARKILMCPLMSYFFETLSVVSEMITQFV
jgi:hypothetical protein